MSVPSTSTASARSSARATRRLLELHRPQQFRRLIGGGILAAILKRKLVQTTSSSKWSRQLRASKLSLRTSSQATTTGVVEWARAATARSAGRTADWRGSFCDLDGGGHFGGGESICLAFFITITEGGAEN
ncbi:hypothetical protein PF003_g21978 [Phytophthora fragariae]|nr:hypothetical protein PF003_g21978 [Phytophthora fragariae]